MNDLYKKLYFLGVFGIVLSELTPTPCTAVEAPSSEQDYQLATVLTITSSPFLS